MFKIIKQSTKSNARIGLLRTQHGDIKTPFFMPDATRGAVKSLSSDDLARLGLESMVVNTYHLYLQPGMEIVKKSKGIHEFMNWDKSLLSDSGGYQVFSLIHKNKSLGKITDEKVIFRSPLDGSSHELTPEKSIQIQFDLGVDMMVCLDDCPPNDASNETMSTAISRTIAWAKRCKVEFEKQVKKRKLGAKRPLLFCVIQGGTNLELRKKCFDALEQIGFSAKGGPDQPLAGASGWDGYGFGARHVDEGGKFLSQPLSFTADLIPEDKLRFGLGIGAPNDILRAVKMGWDMFDCVIPTREARHGKLYSFRHSERGVLAESRNLVVNAFSHEIPRQTRDDGFKSINITNSKYKKDFSPINPTSKLPELKQYTKSYLHHLFKTQEPLALRLATLNNVEFYLGLMARIRQAIQAGKL